MFEGPHKRYNLCDRKYSAHLACNYYYVSILFLSKTFQSIIVFIKQNLDKSNDVKQEH